MPELLKRQLELAVRPSDQRLLPIAEKVKRAKGSASTTA
jgi:hypothetical protein